LFDIIGPVFSQDMLFVEINSCQKISLVFISRRPVEASICDGIVIVKFDELFR